MSATLDRDSDPERPSRASSIDPVQDEHSDVTTVPTAVAEPELAHAEPTSADRNGAAASGASMIVLAGRAEGLRAET